MKTLLYASAGFFIVYLSTEIYKFLKKFIGTTDVKEIPPSSVLVYEIFPFSHLPTENQTNFQMNLEKFDILAKAVEDLDYCLECIFSEMLFFKISKILFEKKNPSHKEIRSCLWLLVHCILKVGTQINKTFLSTFQIEQFYKFLQEKPLDITKAKEIFGLVKGYYDQNGIYQTEALEYPVEIVYLAYVVLANQYSLTLSDPKLEFSSKFIQERELESVPKKYMILLKEKLKDISYSKIEMKGEKVNLDQFDLFIQYTSKFMCCDNSSLVKLSLATLGQFVASCNNTTFQFLIENKNLKLKFIFQNIILCNDVSVLQILGKTMFTIFLKDTQFLNELLSTGFNNEIVQLGVFNTNSPLKLQYMSILYLSVLMNSNFCKKLIENKKIDIFNHLCFCLQSTDEDTNFMALQLLFGIGNHYPEYIIKFTRKEKYQILDLLRNYTFVPQKLLRYYSMLIWSCLIKSKNYLEYLMKKEQLFTVLTSVVKEEKELSILNIGIKILKEICTKENGNHVIEFLGSYDILFLLIDRCNQIIDSKREDILHYAIDIYLFLISLIDFDRVKETLIQLGIQHVANKLITDERVRKSYEIIFK